MLIECCEVAGSVARAKFTSLANYRPTIQKKFAAPLLTAQTSAKSTSSNNNNNITPVSGSSIGQYSPKNSDHHQQQQQQQQQGSSKKGKFTKFKRLRKSWSWKAGAGWTILSVLDWWLLAAGGWLTWRGVFLKWTPLGICIVAAVQWHLIKDDHEKKGLARTASQWQTNVYCSLPLRLMSRGWGWIADCRVPIPIRPLVYGCYSTAFGVNLEEAASPEFKNYRSLAQFFARSLRENARLIDATSCLVSPADGRVLHVGLATAEQIEQVKGVSYSLKSFLGPANWVPPTSDKYVDNIRMKAIKETELYQCIIYLAPGDYHRFHSPTEWTPSLRRHFTGELLSVSPKVAKWLPGLFCLNERALYIGQWQHGFFSFTAVGATNVGSVEIYIDDELKTNRWTGLKMGKQNASDCYDERLLPPNTSLGKGELLGQFNMGSTVVLIFEAPKNFKFFIEPGQTIKMGQPLGCTKERSVAPTSET